MNLIFLTDAKKPMRSPLLLLLIMVAVGTSLAVMGVIIFEGLPQDDDDDDDDIKTLLKDSGPYIGTDIPRVDGVTGEGITVAVIDTGVDFNHPDLFGWAPNNDGSNNNAKVIGGYNFIDQTQPPMDTSGHGTQVAGIIAADGHITGIAPKAKILAYKVSEDGEGVSSDLIVRAIQMAIKDGADIINISLGVNKTNTRIDHAVNQALQEKIFVVTAAGNDGPGAETIGSPGRNFGSVTVGATYNNLTSSLIATLEVDGTSYIAIPMVGTTKADKPITGNIVQAGYGKVTDTEHLQLEGTDTILIVKRGSDVADELLYFSIKEENAYNAGAKALIVYNDKPGIFLGELVHEFVREGYMPHIPVVSIDGEDGLDIIRAINNNGDNEATMNLFYNPDFVVHFSSRGPVSPFYIKPDIVAPGAYINTTQSGGGYNFTSGTSYAAPHVSGAAALLMEKNPQLQQHEIGALLLTTVKPISDAYGTEFSLHDAGAGRLDIRNAYNANLIVLPPSFVDSMSQDKQVVQKEFRLKLLDDDDNNRDNDGNNNNNNNNNNNTLNDNTFEGIDVRFEGPQFIEFTHVIINNTLHATMQATQKDVGEHRGKIVIQYDGISYTVPFLLHYTEGAISTMVQDQRLYFEIGHPEGWDFAKITVIDGADNSVYATATATGAKDTASVQIHKNSVYWIDAKIRVGDAAYNAYDTVNVTSLAEDYMMQDGYILDAIPQRQMAIIVVMLAGIALVGVVIKRRGDGEGGIGEGDHDHDDDDDENEKDGSIGEGSHDHDDDDENDENEKDGSIGEGSHDHDDDDENDENEKDGRDEDIYRLPSGRTGTNNV